MQIPGPRHRLWFRKSQVGSGVPPADTTLRNAQGIPTTRDERGGAGTPQSPVGVSPRSWDPESARSPSLQPRAPVLTARPGPFLRAPCRLPGPRPTRRSAPQQGMGGVGGLPDWPAARLALGKGAGRHGARHGSERLPACSATRVAARLQCRLSASQPGGDGRETKAPPRTRPGHAPPEPRPRAGSTTSGRRRLLWGGREVWQSRYDAGKGEDRQRDAGWIPEGRSCPFRGGSYTWRKQHRSCDRLGSVNKR